MAKAVETGMPKMKIEEAAAKKQARIDSGQDVIVGVNKYPPPAGEAGVDVRQIDNRAVLAEQQASLKAVRASRDSAAVDAALAAIADAAKAGDGNLLALSVRSFVCLACVLLLTPFLSPTTHRSTPRACGRRWARFRTPWRAFSRGTRRQRQ